jgi:hypothetical protein
VPEEAIVMSPTSDHICESREAHLAQVAAPRRRTCSSPAGTSAASTTGTTRRAAPRRTR